VLRYVIVAALVMGGLYTAFYYPYEPGHPIARAIDVYGRFLARAAGALIGVFDRGVSVEDRLINGSFPLLIVKSCSALDAQALYVGAVLAFPAAKRKKALGLFAGIFGLTTFNVVRLAALYFVGAHTPRYFDVLHEEVWPLALVALACACFVGWTTWARHERPQAT
jgi:exosortase/archaeosortase family protein